MPISPRRSPISRIIGRARPYSFRASVKRPNPDPSPNLTVLVSHFRKESDGRLIAPQGARNIAKRLKGPTAAREKLCLTGSIVQGSGELHGLTICVERFLELA